MRSLNSFYFCHEYSEIMPKMHHLFSVKQIRKRNLHHLFIPKSTYLLSQTIDFSHTFRIQEKKDHTTNEMKTQDGEWSEASYENEELFETLRSRQTRIQEKKKLKIRRKKNEKVVTAAAAKNVEAMHCRMQHCQALAGCLLVYPPSIQGV